MLKFWLSVRTQTAVQFWVLVIQRASKKPAGRHHIHVRGDSLGDCLRWSFQTHRGEFSGINSQDQPWTHLIQCCWVYFKPYDKGVEGGFSCASIWLLDTIPMRLWWNRKMTCVTGYLFLADVAIPSPFSRAGTRVKQEKCLVHKLERGTHPQGHQGQCSSLPWSPSLLIRVAAS